MTGERTLILGAAVGYTADHLRPFLGSLANIGYRGDLMLLVGALDADTRDLLTRHNVQCLGFAIRRYSTMVVHASRYLAYLEMLRSARIEYRHILLTDTRDVVFQSDPFHALPSGSLFCFLEDHRRTIGSCQDNSTWVSAAFGESALRELADRPISCSGVTLGTTDGILRYLDALTSHFTQVPPEALQRVGIDQGIHNVLLHRGSFEGARIVPNRRLVDHLGYVPLDEIRLSDGFIVTDPAGAYCSVVHQYDRWLYLDDVIRAKYGAPPRQIGAR